MAIKLTRRPTAYGFDKRITARVTRSVLPYESRRDHVVVVDRVDNLTPEDVAGYAALLSALPIDESDARHLGVPTLTLTDVDTLLDDYVVSIDKSGASLRILYRPESPHNTVFTTDRCNSNCLMCSQPPKDIDDSDLLEHHLKQISLIKAPPRALGITGGEPTLLGESLVTLLTAIRDKLPDTSVHMLTNGRTYADGDFVQQIAAVKHPDFVSAVPLYSDVGPLHDYVVQAEGAFDQTLEGLYNAAEHGLRTEIRVVLHKQTTPRLGRLAQFIGRNLPFVNHVALMGLEHMGYVKKNWDLLWIDPVDYSQELEEAVRELHHRQIPVSIYNLQLCILPKQLWAFARQSISDYKNVYIDECDRCSVRDRCSGLFLSQEIVHSRGIGAIPGIADAN